MPWQRPNTTVSLSWHKGDSLNVSLANNFHTHHSWNYIDIKLFQVYSIQNGEWRTHLLGDVSATRGASYVIHLHPEVWYAVQLRDVTSSYALVSVQTTGKQCTCTCIINTISPSGVQTTSVVSLNLQAKFSLGLKPQTTFLTDLPFLAMTSLIYSDLDTLTVSLIKLEYFLPKAGLPSFKIPRP